MTREDGGHGIPARRRLIVFAHRGGARGRRENTLAAFAQALAAGAPGLESDVWLTADKVAVLHHDGSVGALGRRRPLSALPRTALPARIPTLADLYRSCGASFELSLDVCDPGALPAVTAASSAVGGLGRLWLCHGDPARLARWRPLVGPARLVHSTTSWKGTSEDAGGLARALQASGIDAVNLFWRQWNRPLVEAFKGRGVLALAWGVPGRRRARQLAEMGLDGLYGDRVEALLSGGHGPPAPGPPPPSPPAPAPPGPDRRGSSPS